MADDHNDLSKLSFMLTRNIFSMMYCFRSSHMLIWLTYVLFQCFLPTSWLRRRGPGREEPCWPSWGRTLDCSSKTSRTESASARWPATLRRTNTSVLSSTLTLSLSQSVLSHPSLSSSLFLRLSFPMLVFVQYWCAWHYTATLSQTFVSVKTPPVKLHSPLTNKTNS